MPDGRERMPRKPRDPSTRRGTDRLDPDIPGESKKLPVRIPASLIARIRRRAELLGVPVSDLVRHKLLQAFPASLDHVETLEMREDWVPPNRDAVFELAEELKPPSERAPKEPEIVDQKVPDGEEP